MSQSDANIRPEPPPVTPPTLPPDFPDVLQNPSSELQPPPDPSATPDKVAGTLPPSAADGEKAAILEPSDDEILQGAKELCREDGKAWDLANLHGGAGEGTIIGSDSDRAEYLNRAKALLRQE
jgi:hypothetical protein